jgi:hypothetical protein
MKKRAVARFPLLCIVVLVCLFALCRDASAERFRFQWGARLSVSEEYDNNINLSSDNEDHDWITRLTPGLSISLFTEETEARLSYDFSLVQYARNDARSEGRHFLTLTGFQGIRVAEHVTLDLDTVLRISEDPFETSDPTEDVTDVSNAQNRQYRTTLGGRMRYFYGPEDSIFAGFRYQMLLNEDSGVEDRREYYPSAGMEYWFSLRYGARLDYAYAKTDFDVSDNYDEHLGTASFLVRVNPKTEANLTYVYDNLDYDGARLDYVVHTATVGLSHRLSEYTAASISGGYFVVVPEEGDDRGRFTGALSLTHTTQRSEFTLNGDAGYRRQFFQTENLGLSLYGSVTLNFTYQFMERLSGSLTGAYFRDEYLETEEERTSDNWRGGAGLNWVLLRWLTGSLGYEYRQRDSNIAENDYKDHRVILSFTATHTGEPKPL